VNAKQLGSLHVEGQQLVLAQALGVVGSMEAEKVAHIQQVLQRPDASEPPGEAEHKALQAEESELL